MQTVEITNPVEARRCRIVQYLGRPAELSLNGSRFFGMVRAVQEDRSCTPPRWIVTIVPTAGKPPPRWLAVSYARPPRFLGGGCFSLNDLGRALPVSRPCGSAWASVWGGVSSASTSASVRSSRWNLESSHQYAGSARPILDHLRRSAGGFSSFTRGWMAH